MNQDREYERAVYRRRLAEEERLRHHPDAAEIRYFSALDQGYSHDEILLSLAVCSFLIGVNESVSDPDERRLAVRSALMLMVEALGPLVKGPQGDQLAAAWRECYRSICVVYRRMPKDLEDLELDALTDALSRSAEEWERDTDHERLDDDEEDD